MKNPYDNAITDYCFAHYLEKGMCSLCGQSGIIDTTGTRTPGGLEVGRVNYCICPNGQCRRNNGGKLIGVAVPIGRPRRA